MAKSPGDGELSHDKVEDACWKIWTKTLKEANLGVAQALLDP